MPEVGVDGVTGIYYFDDNYNGLTKFNFLNDRISGWEIMRDFDIGVDIWGTKIGSNLVWSNQGAERIGGFVSSQFIGKASGSFTASYTNAWGYSGSVSFWLATSYVPSSCFYESLFDGYADGWSGTGGTWSVTYVSDPGNYIDNRIYRNKQGATTGWNYSMYTPHTDYLSGTGLEYGVDLRRMEASSTSTGIVFFSGSNPTQNCYEFFIAYSGYYSLFKVVSGSASTLRGWTASSYINTGAGEWNNIRVETKVGWIDLFINGHYVNSAHDTTFTSGRVGLLTFSSANSTVEYDNMTLHRDTSDVAQDTLYDEPVGETVPGDETGTF